MCSQTGAAVLLATCIIGHSSWAPAVFELGTKLGTIFSIASELSVDLRSIPTPPSHALSLLILVSTSR